jgi:hypothetical protein
LLSLPTFIFSMNSPDNVGFWLRFPLLLLGATYCSASISAASQVAIRERSVAALLMPISFLFLHVSYGIGTLFAVVSNAHRPSAKRDRGEWRSLSSP